MGSSATDVAALMEPMVDEMADCYACRRACKTAVAMLRVGHLCMFSIAWTNAFINSINALEFRARWMEQSQIGSDT